jgi:hypothetical protein
MLGKTVEKGLVVKWKRCDMLPPRTINNGFGGKRRPRRETCGESCDYREVRPPQVGKSWGNRGALQDLQSCNALIRRLCRIWEREGTSLLAGAATRYNMA